ncbi:hypothetical protein D3C87_1596310 [compost metagenome]
MERLTGEDLPAQVAFDEHHAVAACSQQRGPCEVDLVKKTEGHRSVGEARPLQFRLNEARLVEMARLHLHVPQLALGEEHLHEARALQRGAGEIGLHEAPALKHRLVHARPLQRAPEEPGVFQAAVREVALAHEALREHAVLEVGARQVDAAEIDSLEHRARQIEPAQVPASSIDAGHRVAMTDALLQFVQRHVVRGARRAGQTLAPRV